MDVPMWERRACLRIDRVRVCDDHAVSTRARVMTPRSRAAAQLLNAAGPDWRAVVTRGFGFAERGVLGEPRGDGTRPRVTEHVPCRSEAVRLVGPRSARAVALWVQTPPEMKWKTAGAWSWTHGQAPRPIGVMELRTVVQDVEESTEEEAA